MEKPQQFMFMWRNSLLQAENLNFKKASLKVPKKYTGTQRECADDSKHSYTKQSGLSEENTKKEWRGRLLLLQQLVT